jgi:two-component system sensor histidine kinase UhpB
MQKLRNRLLLRFVLILVFPLAVIGALVLYFINHQYAMEFDSRLRKASHDARSELQNAERDALSTARALAGDERIIRALTSTDRARVLNDLQQTENLLKVEMVMLISPDGTVLARSDRPGELGTMKPDREMNVLKDGPHSRLVHQGFGAEVEATAPVLAEDDVKGVVLVRRSVDYPFLEILNERFGVQCILLDGARVQASTIEDSAVIRSLAINPTFALETGRPIRIGHYQLMVTKLKAESGEQIGTLAVGLSELPVIEAMNTLALWFGAVELLVFAAAAAVSARISKSITVPIETLSRVSELIAKHDFSQRLTPTTNDEIGALAASYNEMAAELERTTTSIDNLNREIAEKTKAQEAQRASEESLRITLNSIGDAVIATDLEGRVARMNPVAVELTGWRFADANNRPLSEVFDIRREETGERVESPVTKVLRDGAVVGLANHTELVRRDGTKLPIADSGAPIRDASGKVAGVVLVFRDQTAERQAESLLRRSEERYQLAVLGTNEGIWDRDLITNKVYLSDRYLELIGFSRSDAPDNFNFFQEHLHQDDCTRVLQAVTAHLAQRTPYDVEYRLRTKSNGYRWFRSRGQAIWNSEGKPVRMAGSIADITERKQIEAKLLAYQQQLQSLSSRLLLVEERERRSFSRMLHDHIGQNLTYAKLKLGVLRNDSVSDSNVKNAVEEILNLVEQMNRDTRSLTYELSPPLLYEIGLDAALEWLGEHFQARYGLTCNFEGSPGAEALDIDARIVLFQGARELLFNVVKHAQAKSAMICVVRGEQRVAVTVSDDGVGFDPARIAASGNSGFGLFSVKERLTHIGGSVEIESRPDGGSRITLIMPKQQRTVG